MFFSSVKEIKWLLKEINRFLSQRMSNIYLKGTIEKKWRSLKFGFCKFKKFVSESIFGELQLTQTLLNFENFLLELKNQRSGSKTVCHLCYFSFEKNYDVLQWKSSCFLLNKNINLIKTRRNRKWKIPETLLERWALCVSARGRILN